MTFAPPKVPSLTKWAILGSSLLLMGASCGPKTVKTPEPPVNELSSQVEAGAVEVAVQSVAPFEEYIEQLQPRFTLGGQTALDEAIAQSQIQQIQALRALILSLQVSLPLST